MYKGKDKSQYACMTKNKNVIKTWEVYFKKF